MMKGVYTYKDDLSGSFEYFGVFNNDALARRAFLAAVRGAEYGSGDLSLYHSGYLDSNSGALVCDGMDVIPKFVCRGNEE